MQYLKTGGFFLLFFFAFSALVFSQDSTQVSWKAVAARKADNRYELLVKGIIKKGWHVYDSNNAQDLSGIIVSIDDSLVTAGTIQYLTKSKTIADVVFENKSMQVTIDSIIFSQEIKINGQVPSAVKIKLNYETGY
ncbi:MAG: hypothetical protein ABJA37_10640, partial [Ferruginibacter sp.]